MWHLKLISASQIHPRIHTRTPTSSVTVLRSIAMSVPDNELIAEVLLLSEGFITAKVREAGDKDVSRTARNLSLYESCSMLCCLQDLARKLIALFSLSRELLSPQQHYDWGLRALKTSLGIAGRELREVRIGEMGTIVLKSEREII